MPYQWIVPLVTSALGAMSGGQSTPSATTQRVEQVRPVLTPEEQAMQNYIINQIYGNIGQTSPLQNLIQSYYGGGGYQPMTMGGMPGIQPVTQPISQITPEQTRQQYEQAVKANRWEETISPALQKMNELLGGQPVSRAFGTGGIRGAARTREIGKGIEEISKQLGMTIDETKNLYEQWRVNPQEVAQKYALPVQPVLEQLGPQAVQSITDQGLAQQPITQPITAQGAEQYTPLGEIMQQSPEQLGAQYDILRQQGMKGIEDWWQQAQREFEQRGISQYGGYMGTLAERDIGGLLAERGRMQTNLGQQLGLSQLQAQQQLPYSQLQALEDVRRFEAQNLLAQQTPWLQAAQNIYSVPWGQTTAVTSQQPVGVIPGAISGAYTGAGLYQMGQNMGWWGSQSQPATSYGAGLATPGTTSGFQLAGTQQAWNQFNPWG